MPIALTDDHRELGGVARSFLTAQKARWSARELLDADEETTPPFWRELAELGWLGLHIDERHGGSGFGLPELVVVIDELGRAVAPGPFVPTVVVSAVIDAVGTEEQKARLLPGLIDGSRTAAVGFGGDVAVSDGHASGDAGVVLGAGLAEVLLLAAGEDMILVERTAAGVTENLPGSLDLTRRSGQVTLSNVAVGDNVLPGARQAALARARTLFAAEAVGGASDCVDTAVEYAKVREQFGRTIATFQAVKHHCILPSDFDDYRANDGVILDDWLAGWVMTMHERTRLVVIFDCCYSGSDLELHHSSIRKVTYISGCRDNQTSEDAIDIDDTYKYTGAMTTFMIQILKASPKTFNDTMLLHRDLCDRLRASGFSQVPVLTSTHSLVQDPIFIPARRRSTTSPVPNTTFFEKMF